MKQLRHRLGVFLLGIMLLGTGVGSFFVYADNAAVSDEMWSTLDDMAHTFGLIDLEVNADDIVTRAEYVMLATKIMNLQERQSGGTYFSDVKAPYAEHAEHDQRNHPYLPRHGNRN